MAGTTVNTFIRRRRGPESGMKRRRFALEEILRTGTIVETLLPPCEHSSRRLDYADTVPDCPVKEAEKSGEYPTNVDESYRELVAERRKGKKIAILRDVLHLGIILDDYFRIFMILQRSRSASRSSRQLRNERFIEIFRVASHVAKNFREFARNWKGKTEI